MILKSNFHKRFKSSDGFHPQCNFWMKQYYVDNKNRLLNKRKFYNKENRDRIKEYQLKNHDKIKDKINNFFIKNKNKFNESLKLYEKNRLKTDVSFRLFRNTRRRIHHALNGKLKSSSTRELLVIDIEAYRRWTEWQLSPDTNWQNIEIDHVKAICFFDVSKHEHLKLAFSWKNTQPLLKHDHQQKVRKLSFLDYQLHFIKAYQILKLNEKRHNEDIHQWIIE